MVSGMYASSAPSKAMPALSSASRTLARSPGAESTCQPSSPPITSSAPAASTTSKSRSSVRPAAVGTSTRPRCWNVNATLPETPRLPPFLSKMARTSGAVFWKLPTSASTITATPPGA